MTDTRLIHVRVPAGLLERLDRQVPAGRRSSVVAAALDDYLRLLERRSAIQAVAGSLTDEETRRWPDSAAVDSWVSELRRQWPGAVPDREPDA